MALKLVLVTLLVTPKLGEAITKDEVIDKIIDYYDEAIRVYDLPASSYKVNKDYLNTLKKNNSSILQKKIDEIDTENKSLHQSLQFYFSTRKKIEPLSLENFDKPPLPLRLSSLDSTNTSFKPLYDLDYPELIDPGVRLRLSFIDAILDLGMDKVKQVDADGTSVAQIATYLNELSSIHGVTNNIEYGIRLKKIGNLLHETKYLQNNIENKPDKQSEDDIKRYLKNAIESTYSQLWENNPQIFANEIDSIIDDLNKEVKNFEKLSKLEHSKLSNDEVSEIKEKYVTLSQIYNFFKDHSQYFQSNNLPETNGSKTSNDMKDILFRKYIYRRETSEVELNHLKRVLLHYIQNTATPTYNMQKLYVDMSRILNQFHDDRSGF